MDQRKMMVNEEYRSVDRCTPRLSKAWTLRHPAKCCFPRCRHLTLSYHTSKPHDDRPILSSRTNHRHTKPTLLFAPQSCPQNTHRLPVTQAPSCGLSVSGDSPGAMFSMDALAADNLSKQNCFNHCPLSYEAKACSRLHCPDSSNFTMFSISKSAASKDMTTVEFWSDGDDLSGNNGVVMTQSNDGCVCLMHNTPHHQTQDSSDEIHRHARPSLPRLWEALVIHSWVASWTQQPCYTG